MTSIRRRLVIALLPAVVVLAAGSGTALYLYLHHVLWRQFDNALAAKASALAAAVEWDDKHPLLIDSPDRSAAEFATQPHPAYFQVFSSAGQSLLRSDSLGQSDLPPAEATRPASAPGRPAPWDTTLPDGRPGRAVAITFVPELDADDPGYKAGAPPATQPVMTLVLAEDYGSVVEPLQVLLTSLVVGAALLAVGTIAIVILAVRLSLRPLEQLAERAASPSVDVPGPRFPTSGLPAELLPICARLNQLIDGLGQAMTRERRFTADVAHELRTPIAELTTLAEVAMKWPPDQEAAAIAFDEALHIAQHMESKVIALLALARCHAGKQALSVSPTDLSKIVTESWRPHSAMADNRELKVHFDLPERCEIQSDSTLVSSIVDNLLSNAARYTPQGGDVIVRLRRGDAVASLTLQNTNMSLVQNDLPHLFEPFWRKDAARSDGSHAGLGLALVQAYARLLGAKLDANLTDPRTFQIALDLPCL